MRAKDGKKKTRDTDGNDAKPSKAGDKHVLAETLRVRKKNRLEKRAHSQHVSHKIIERNSLMRSVKWQT